MATSAFIQGIALGASMIIPIGAQNSFLITQGIRRNYHYLTATMCLVCDIFLTTLGVFGGGQLITSNDLILNAVGWGGILFLLTYAGIAFRRAWQFNYSDLQQNSMLSSRKAVIATALVVTLLNPHAYLDTVVILGTVGSTFLGDARLFFALGAIVAAMTWFFGLAASAAKLAPILAKPKNQRIIDVIVGLVMFAIAYKVFIFLFSQHA
ncbi:LysE/ArgO family amino acid transporter [Thalassotalea ganghwensis]